MSVAEFGKSFARRWEVMKPKLKEGTYQPAPVLGVEISKANGGQRLQRGCVADGRTRGDEHRAQLAATPQVPTRCSMGFCGVHLDTAGSTAGCGKPHVRWCGRGDGRNPVIPTRLDYRAFGPPCEPLSLDISGAISAPSRRLEKEATVEGPQHTKAAALVDLFAREQPLADFEDSL